LIYKTIITKAAELDIAETVQYIAKELHNKTAAGNLLDDIENAAASLRKMPKRYALVQDEYLSSLGFRFIPIKKYLMFYIVREEKNSVTIERFLFSRRNWSHIIGQEMSR